VLPADPLLAAAELRLGLPPAQLFQSVRPGHGSTVVGHGRKVNGFIDSRRDLR
jgi:hypothetical protein